VVASRTLRQMRGFPESFRQLPQLILTCVLLGTVSCSRAAEDSPSLSEVAIPSAHSLLPLAMDAARNWRPDSHLIFAHVGIHPDARVTFGFNSSSDPRLGLNVHIEDPLGQPTARTVEVSSPTRGEALPSIDAFAGGRVDSVDAFNSAIDAGARSYLRDHPEAWEATWLWNVNLQYATSPEGDVVVWRVYFTNLETDGYEVLIDPQTGDVLEVAEGP